LRIVGVLQIAICKTKNVEIALKIKIHVSLIVQMAI